ncbi:putative bifunctional diguanylate cyclase/phosphodiesterase [Acidisoma cladoniae]|jgi:diguanylate cyclase (GGDEF)-like protein/PAS domain S-box-containing protein|uniref:putative bifunctional diguanylate cyclase/phosphodiesterase n=1 Tax=Acidisoma cladoniae TaxID=3040935 RepID=UPI0025511915|nr:EAL domain-containing protein [Acidisoma sp. PAMC 29798]
MLAQPFGKLRRRNRARLPLFAVLLCFGVATVYTFYLSLQQDQTVDSLVSYDDAFDSAQGTIEMMRLQVAVSAFEMRRPDTSAELVNLRFAILENRMSVLSRPSFLQFISGHPETDGIVESLSETIAQIKLLLPHLTDPGVAAQIITLLNPLDAEMTQLASVANSLVGNQFEFDQSRLKNQHLIFSGVMFALIAIGILLIIMLLRDNRLMMETNRDLNLLTGDLQATSAALAAAHSATAKANEDLAAQNAALRNRDEALRIQNARFNAALNNMSHGLLMADKHDRLIVSNTRFLEMFGLRGEETEPGASLETVFRLMVERKVQPTILIEQIRAHTRELVASNARGLFYSEGENRSIQVSHVPMFEGGWVATYEDITERRKIEANTDYLAHHDALTGLPNRLMFSLFLGTALRNRTENDFSSLLLLDVDHFKDVNDTLGHLGGDALLVMIASRLQGCIRDDDVVARLGGDEFAVIQMRPSSRDETIALADRLVGAVGQPYTIDGRRVVIGVSIGVSICNDETQDAEQLLRNADMALYRSKAEGRSTWRFFESEMEAEVRVRSTIAADIRDALEMDHLEVVYQPVIDVVTGQLCQFEGLLRWNHPTLGVIQPSRFIPIAEETRMIIPIGEAVLRRACLDAAEWPAEVRVAVNLSPMQFEDRSLTRVVESALRDARLDPSRLELEITEGALLRDGDEVRATLVELRALGVTIALDDFGTGYASLSYLRRFPFDKIKIDRSFIGDSVLQTDSIAIIEAIVSLATKLGMTTTAEGIETTDQWRLLNAIGCTYAQGYYFDRPQSLQSIKRKMKSGAYPLKTPIEAERTIGSATTVI